MGNKLSKKNKKTLDVFSCDNEYIDILNNYAAYLILQLIEYANTSNKIPFLDKNIQQVFKLIAIFDIKYELTRLRDLLFSCIINFDILNIDNIDKLYKIAPIDNIDMVIDIGKINDQLKFYIGNFYEFYRLITNGGKMHVIGSNVVSFNSNYRHGIILDNKFSVYNNQNNKIGNGSNGIVYKNMLIFISNQAELISSSTSLVSTITNNTCYYEYAKKTLTTSSIQNDGILLDLAIGIDHPFIIKCFINQGSNYYLELCHAPSKTDYFKFIKISKFLIAQLVLALHYLETKQIAHGDLHLDQLLIGRDGFLRLSDFGLSENNKGNDIDQIRFFEFIIIELFKIWENESGEHYVNFCSIIQKGKRSKITSHDLKLKYSTLPLSFSFSDVENNYYLIDKFKEKYPDLDIEIFFDIFGINYQFSQLINHQYLCDESDWDFLLKKEKSYYKS